MNNLEFLDILSIISFSIQMENNEELHKQSSNNDVLKHLHDDITVLMEDNRFLCNKIIEQNEQIIRLLGGVKDAQSNREK